MKTSDKKKLPKPGTLAFKIVALRDKGYSYTQIEDKTGASSSWVWKVLRQYGRIERPIQKKTNKKKMMPRVK